MEYPDTPEQEAKSMAEQATDERTLDDLDLHLRKVDSHLRLYFHLQENGSGDSEAARDTLAKAHDRICKAYNTTQYLREQRDGN